MKQSTQELRQQFVLPRRMRLPAQVGGMAILILGLFVMAGWHLHVPSLIQVHPLFVPMQYNTALAFVFAGVGLLSITNRFLPGIWLAAAVVSVIGGLTLIENLLTVDLGLDQLFMQHYITVGTSFPGRMAPNTALCFALTGVAYLLIARKIPGDKSWSAAGLLATLVISFSCVALIGYLLGLQTAYGWGLLTRMAVHTALGFLVLGGCLLVVVLPSNGSDSSFEWRPLSIGIFTAIVTLTLWYALQSAGLENGAGIMAADFMLGFGLIMALALARAVHGSLGMRRAMAVTDEVLLLLRKEVAERRHAEEQVRHLAFYDTLTNLPNRRLFQDRMALAMSAHKRNTHCGALLFLDLDNFKPVNDLHGHEAGDALLVEVAARLKQCVRDADTVTRFGGDEFVLLLCDLDTAMDQARSYAETIAERVRVALGEPFELIDKRVPGQYQHFQHTCTASIGITLFSGHEDSQNSVLKRADQAMYEAKAAGRNVVHFIEAAPNT